jgi:hypothetical protein
LAKSNIQLQVLSEKDGELWDEFVAKSPQGTIFQKTAYLKCYAEVFKRKLLKIAITQDDQIIAALPLLPKKIGWILYATVPYLIPYNGPVLSANRDGFSYLKKVKLFNKVAEEILDYIQKHFHFLEMYLSDSLPDLREFVWKQWQFSPDYTIEVPLESLSIRNLPHNQRRHINKFSQLPSEFTETVDFEKCYDLMHNSYAYHQKRPPISKVDFQKFTTALSENKLLKSFAIIFENQIAAFLMTIEDPPYAYALFSGKEFSQTESESELYLHWKLMEHYSSKRYKYLNLLGAMSPSISRVKLELGGILRRHDHALYFKNGFYQLLYNIEKLRRNRNRQLP